MKFKEWIKNQIFQINDVYDLFLNNIQFKINENIGPLIIKAEFLLEESKKPWGDEKWLDDSNQKIIKTSYVDEFTKQGKKLIFEPYIINLLPAKQSGINLCICATKHCAATCLHSSGAIQYLVNKTMGRLRKSWFIALDRDAAFSQIVQQISSKKKKIDEKNKKNKKEHVQMIVRLNGTSDLIWRAMVDSNGKNIFELFPDIMYYDYSKHSSEMNNFIRGEVLDEKGNKVSNFPENYHLTLSYGGPGGNVSDYKNTLKAGENLAVPFSPGKTSSLDRMKFPKNIEELLKNFYYPEHINDKQSKNDYKNQIINKIKEDGNYVEAEELAQFSGKTLLPGLFMCHEVIDGDDYDARFLDDLMLQNANMPENEGGSRKIEINNFSRRRKKHGIVIGLTAKGDLTFSSYKGTTGWDVEHTGFMVGPNDPEIDRPCKPLLNFPHKEAFLKKKTELFKKISKAILTIRNFDARHVHGAEESRTKVFKGPSKKVGTLTYQAKKGLTNKEMNELINIIQLVMKGESPDLSGRTKLKSAAKNASKLRDYLRDPETIKMLNDEEFKRKAREIGIDINFENLARLVNLDSKRDPNGPKRTVMPNDMLKILGGQQNEAFIHRGEIDKNFAMAVYSIMHNKASAIDWEIIDSVPKEKALENIKKILIDNGINGIDLKNEMQWWIKQIDSTNKWN